jgi:thiamine biosynthesis lipoprotein
VPPTLATVVEAAAQLSRESAGAFDVTVGPLVNLWGFGPQSDTATPTAPGDDAIARARQRVGFDKLDVRLDPPALRKRADVYVDLSAIAKGHGVDRVTERLLGAGCSDLLVDVGGEVRGIGRSANGRIWRVGVETPDPGQLGGIERVIVLDDVAAATSGDYRNYREVDGQRFSHTIDPRSGRPAAHALASVTVLHPSAMWADGYATALDVLGPEAGFELAERLELPALFIVRQDGAFQARYTPALESALIE